MQYQAISVIQLQKIQNSIKTKYKLEVPFYTMNLQNGNTQIVEHDENSIEDSKTSQVEKDKWVEYQAQLKIMQSEINEKSTAYIFYKGIDCEVSEEWIAEQDWLEIKLPENKFDVKVMYITTELLKTPDEIKQAMLTIMKLSTKGVDESAIKAAEDTFLGTQEK